MGIWTGLSPGGSLALGVIVGLLSTCVQSVGLTLQRKSHMLEDEKAEHEVRRPAYRRRRWQIGMFLFLIANIIGSSIQITTLPLPLLSTLQASGLVFNSLLASLLLKEAFTWRTAGGTVLVAAGAVLISLFSALPEPSHNLEQLIALLHHKGFLVWFILSLVFVGCMLVMDFAMRRLVSRATRDKPRSLLIRGMGYGAISGILSAHALLLAKSAVELIVRSVADGNNQFRNYRSWLLLLAFLVLALSQLYYLHLGLRLISTSILYPFVFCIYNIVAILDGLIYFRQTDRLPPVHAGLIAVGTVILLAGVLALSWRLEDAEEDDEEHHHHHHPMKHEFPQTVLTPGLGFVGEPDSDGNTESVIADEDDEEDGEEEDGSRQPLLSGTVRRTTTESHGRGSLHGIHKRKRASTLKEVMHIWEEPNDDADDDDYGTFDDRRPGSADQHHPKARKTSRRPRRRRSSIAEEEGEALMTESDPSLLRSRTMPAQGRSKSGRRRRSTHDGGALFRDMIRADWWRTRRKSHDGEHGDEADVQR